MNIGENTYKLKPLGPELMKRKFVDETIVKRKAYKKVFLNNNIFYY